MNTLLIVLGCLASVLLVWAVLLVCFPYEVFKFIIMILRHTCFVERFDGEENVPKTGPAVFVANHVSIFDSFITYIFYIFAVLLEFKHCFHGEVGEWLNPAVC